VGVGANKTSRDLESNRDLESERDECDDTTEWAVREWPEIEAEVERIVNRTSMVVRHLDRAAVDTLDEVGISQGELKVLLRLVRGKRPAGEIARHLLVSTGTMTNRLDKLESGGLLARQPDPNDRRGVIVELTPAGRATLDRYIAVQAKRERQLMTGLTIPEKQELGRLLRKLLASVESESEFVRR
jgi:DNA-binding MarR family transcriptional regulator